MDRVKNVMEQDKINEESKWPSEQTYPINATIEETINMSNEEEQSLPNLTHLTQTEVKRATEICNKYKNIMKTQIALR